MSMHILSLLVLALHLASSECEVTTSRAGHGLIGYGIDMYDPNCAYTCRGVLASSALECSIPAMSGSGTSTSMSMDAETEPACFASDDTFLQTLAWCISTHCKNEVPIYVLEKYWLRNVAGTQSVQPSPKYSYQQALAKIAGDPTETINSGNPLNTTSVVAEEDFIANFNAQAIFQAEEILHEEYGYSHSEYVYHIHTDWLLLVSLFSFQES